MIKIGTLILIKYNNHLTEIQNSRYQQLN